jgi:hypothetical protein
MIFGLLAWARRAAVRRGGRVDAALGACRTDLRIMWRPLLVIRVSQLVSRLPTIDDRHCSTARSVAAADVWLRRTGGDPGV